MRVKTFVYSATEEPDEDISNYIIPIQINCHNNYSQSCSSECKRSLERFQKSRGCCVNALYNSTLAIATGINHTTFPILADNGLFKLCGVETPSLTCKLLTSGSLPLKGFTSLLLLALVMSLLVNGN